MSLNSFRQVPIIPKENPCDIDVRASRWVVVKTSDGKRRLEKTYSFRTSSQRNDFVRRLTQHEARVDHYGDLSVLRDRVVVSVSTEDLNDVTELDREYGKFSDELYRDVCYS